MTRYRRKQTAPPAFFIRDRKFYHRLEPGEHLIGELVNCDQCESYALAQSGAPTHAYRVVYTDGSCRGNGYRNSRSGIAAHYGSTTDHAAWESVDVQTNQQAELRAALLGVQLLLDTADTERCHGPIQRFVIATDSMYVVRGITEWFPRWSTNGWMTSTGRTPANLDLFFELDDALYEVESRFGANSIGLIHVPREENEYADYLAKWAADQC